MPKYCVEDLFLFYCIRSALDLARAHKTVVVSHKKHVKFTYNLDKMLDCS